MRRLKQPYPPEFRSRIVDLVRAGRTQASLAKEFGVTGMTIRSWGRQADLDAGRYLHTLKRTFEGALFADLPSSCASMPSSRCGPRASS